MRSPRSTSCSPAACSSRAATFTASPVTSRWPAAGSPETTSPVFTPVRFASRTPNTRSSSSFSCSSAPCMPAAARTARRASSSCSRGRPKTAMTASPMNFSTTPPCRSSSARMVSKYRVITSRNASESSRSPMLVEPLRSEKTMVTTFRTSCAGAATSSAEPQARQNFAISGFSVPHWPQTGIERVCLVVSTLVRVTCSRNVYRPSTKSPQKGDDRYV